MKKITFIIVLATMALTWTSCEEDKDEVKPVTKTELLTAHPWKLTALTISPAYNGFTDAFANIPCYQDNSESFSSNGVFVQNEGSNVCSPYAQTENGTWSFSSSESILNTKYDSNSNWDASYNILTLSESTLKYSGIIEENGTEYTLTYTFTAQ